MDDVTLEVVVRRTLSIFEGLLGHKLKLVKGDEVATDGVEVHAPLHGPFAYTEVEHCLAHCLFRSDPLVRQEFEKQYVAALLRIAEAREIPVAEDKLRGLISGLFGLLDDVRVESLWGSLYAGSHAEMRERNAEYADQKLGEDPTRLLHYAMAVAASGRCPEGELQAFGPALVRAFARVHRRSFRSVPHVLKRLIHELVERILDEVRGEPGGGGGGGGGEAEDQADGKGSGGGDARAGALSVLSAMGSDEVPPRLQDVQTDRQPQPSKREQVQQQVQDAMQAPPADEQALEEELDGSGGDAEKLLDELEAKLQHLPPPEEDADFERDRVRFQRVTKRDVPQDVLAHVEALSPVELEAVGLLRAQVQRVRGRKVAALGETGYEVDVPTYLQRKLARQDQPCFVREATGRGFRCLLLVDCSSSMEGDKMRSVQRAHRMLVEALRYPFVKLETWGFNALDHRPSVYLFDRGLPLVTGEWAPLTGLTPLPAALDAAATHLRGQRDVCVIVVLSDGHPYAINANHEALGRAQMHAQVRQATRRAKGFGVRVIGAVVGDSRDPGERVSETDMKTMFGQRTDWTLLWHTQIEAGLVRLISGAFLAYLKGG